MNAKEIESLESYFKTDNEHWNGFALDMLCEVLQQGQFDNPETPLKLFNDSMDIITEHHEQPLKAFQLFVNEMDKLKLIPDQKLFVYKWVCKYLQRSEFDFIQTPILELIKSQRDKLETENKPIKPLVKDIRETLKELMQKELEQLPETLKTLEAVQRLNILCRLMPFVLPKVESIHHESGER